MSQNTTSFSLESQISSTRTVFDILWSCLLTIFACTWTVQHLNVPPQREEQGSPGWKGDLRYALKNFWTSAKWMVITILAPEVLITLNAGQLSNAWSCVRGLKKLAEEDGVPWTLTHSLFANMGGFVVREFTPGRMDDSLSLNTKGRQKNNGEVESQEINGAVVDTQAAENAPEGIKHAPSEGVETSPHIGNQIKPDGVEMEEINSTEEMTQSPSQILAGTKNPLYESLEGQPQPEPRAYFILAHEILELRQRGIVKLPYITKDEIMDKGKSDSLHGCSPSGRPFGSWPR